MLCLLWLLCCAVLCCAVLCCVLPCLHRHRCAQGKAAAIDRAEQRGTRYQSKTQRKEKRRPKQHHSRPGDQLGRVCSLEAAAKQARGRVQTRTVIGPRPVALHWNRVQPVFWLCTGATVRYSKPSAKVSNGRCSLLVVRTRLHHAW